MKSLDPRAFAALTLAFCFSLATAGDICKGYGPQTPRNIDRVEGTNKRVFAVAPSYEKMNLCNIHFHTNAEHMAEDFSIYAGKGHQGHGGGYQCKMSKSLSKAELTSAKGHHCKGVKPGDTIEVHWVYTSCDVKPGKGLGSCLSDACANPNLRVEAQVFTVANNPGALNFEAFDYNGKMVRGYHQADALPEDTGTPVVFLGSTTGPKYSEEKCSPLQVTWSVRPKCAKLDIRTLGQWCADNVFDENHAHGVRELVTSPELLSPIN